MVMAKQLSILHLAAQVAQAHGWLDQISQQLATKQLCVTMSWYLLPNGKVFFTAAEYKRND
jgi:hypothetical protein